MSDPNIIPSHPHGLVWVFALDVAEDALEAFEDTSFDGGALVATGPLAEALGLNAARQSHIEIINMTDLKDFGLARYLVEAGGFSLDDVREDEEALNALDGVICLVYAKALDGTEGAFAPTPPARLIGRYGTPMTLPPHQDIDTDSAKGQLPQGKPPMSPARMSGMVATFVLLFLAIFVVLFVWMAG